MAGDSAKSKKGIPCPKCGNRLRVRPDQKGEQVRCPKCNATFVVGRPPKPKPVSPDAEYEPEIPLKKSTIVHEEPVMLDAPGGTAEIVHEEPDRLDVGDAAPMIVPMQAPVTSHLPQYTADWATDEIEVEAPHQPPPSEAPDYLAMARQRGLVREEDDRPLPKWTFFSGVFTFPWQRGTVLRWGIMAMGLTAAGELFTAAILAMVGDLSATSTATPFLLMMTVSLGLVTLAFSSACFLAAVDDTSDGHDESQEETFPPLDQWIFSFFSVLSIWLMSGALGYPLSLVPGLGPPAVLISSLVLFPILFLSAMECESFFLPLSANVWKTLFQFPGAWLAFYLLSTSLLAVWYVPLQIGVEVAPFLSVIVAGPALAAVMLIYARLLGRLAWRVTLADSDTKGRKPSGGRESQSVAVARKGKKRKKVRKLRLPDDLEQPSSGNADQPPAPRERLDFHRPR